MQNNCKQQTKTANTTNNPKPTPKPTTHRTEPHKKTDNTKTTQSQNPKHRTPQTRRPPHAARTKPHPATNKHKTGKKHTPTKKYYLSFMIWLRNNRISYQKKKNDRKEIFTWKWWYAQKGWTLNSGNVTIEHSGRFTTLIYFQITELKWFRFCRRRRNRF